MRSRNVFSILAVLGVALLAVWAFSACGGDDDDDDDVQEAEEDVSDEADDDEGEIEEEVEEEADEESDDGSEGDDDADDDDDNGTDVCSLLTTEEAEALLEEPVSEPTDEGTPTPIFGVCSWAASSETSFAIIVLQVLTDEFPGGAEEFYDTTIEGLDQTNEDYEEISGLGDEAVFYAGLVQAREGDDLIAVSVTLDGGTPEGDRAKSEEAAAIVLDRLD